MKFQHDGHLGYITSCPTNCGTGLRASVHIHLPTLGKDKTRFEAIADKFHVQIRGAHGEHTETDDHIYDISNKRRLGFGEASLVQDMYNGVDAMIQAEFELRGNKTCEKASLEAYLIACKIFKSAQDSCDHDATEAMGKKLVEKEILSSIDLLSLAKTAKPEATTFTNEELLDLILAEANK